MFSGYLYIPAYTNLMCEKSYLQTRDQKEAAPQTCHVTGSQNKMAGTDRLAPTETKPKPLSHGKNKQFNVEEENCQEQINSLSYPHRGSSAAEPENYHVAGEQLSALAGWLNLR